MDQRVTDLEVRISFMEKSLEDLDGVVRELGGQVMAVERELKRLRESVTSAKESAEPPRRLEDEVPPHY